MKRKPIKIDWDALDDAFSVGHGARYYLDSVTGHVALEEEDETDDLDDENDEFEVPSRVRTPAPLREVPTRLYIDPLDPERKLGWMKTFLAEDHGVEPEVVARLAEAVRTEKDPAPMLKDILSRNLEAREIWYGYREDRRHEMIDEWLEENGVEPADPPPWR